jgi:hypothetical protein
LATVASALGTFRICPLRLLELRYSWKAALKGSRDPQESVMDTTTLLLVVILLLVLFGGGYMAAGVGSRLPVVR